MTTPFVVTTEQALYDYMMGFVGIPYHYGGNVPADGGVDCSGLALIYLQAAGKWPHGVDASAQGIFDQVSGAGGKRSLEPGFGDLAFFGAGWRQLVHVGLCLNHWLMLEAGGGDATTSTPAAAAARDAIVRIRPLAYRRDFLGVFRP